MPEIEQIVRNMLTENLEMCEPQTSEEVVYLLEVFMEQAALLSVQYGTVHEAVGKCNDILRTLHGRRFLN